MDKKYKCGEHYKAVAYKTLSFSPSIYKDEKCVLMNIDDTSVLMASDNSYLRPDFNWGIEHCRTISRNLFERWFEKYED